jgi:hypothetical protein
VKSPDNLTGRGVEKYSVCEIVLRPGLECESP